MVVSGGGWVESRMPHPVVTQMAVELPPPLGYTM